MNKAKKLPSGSWRARVTYHENGQRYFKSFTASTKAEAEYLAADFLRNKKSRAEASSVADAVERYIKLSEDVLSPVTIATYYKIAAHAFPRLMQMNTSDLTDNVVQQEINAECHRKAVRTGTVIAPKTVKSEWALVSTALKTIHNLSFNIRLPKLARKNESLPDPAEIMKIIKGSDVELPCLLAMWCSLRMSEVRGLMCSSIQGDYLSIDSVLVDIAGADTRRDIAKTDKSIRRVYLPAEIKRIATSGKVYKEYIDSGEDAPLVPMSRNQIHHQFHRMMAKSGIDMTFHDLRHVYASINLNILQVPERLVMDAGGWSTPSIMKSVYSQSFDVARKEANAALEQYFGSITERTKE